MKYIKFFLKGLLFLFLLVGLFLTAGYYRYNKALPTGVEGVEADRLAEKMLSALNHDAYKALDYIEWTFSSRGLGRQYQWQKSKGRCKVAWDSISVNLNLNTLKKSTVLINDLAYTGELKSDYISAAEAKFNNDSFWLVAPYKLFDKGVERRLVERETGEKALLITYTSGGSTPGDSYLWILGEDYKPTSFQMWVNLIPIGGIAASWQNWQKTTNGAFLPKSHQVLFLDLEIKGLKAY